MRMGAIGTGRRGVAGALALALAAVAASTAAGAVPPAAAASSVDGASLVDRSGEAAASALFDRLTDSPARLRLFLQGMPKGGDLHNHLSGTVYAEDYLRWAAEQGYCVTAATATLSPPPCTAPAEPVRGLGAADPVRYGTIVDGLSTRSHGAGVGKDERTGHDQFFATFSKFGAVAGQRSGESLAAMRTLAAGDHVSYVELIHNPDPLNALVFQTSGALAPDGFEAAYAATRPMLADFLRKARADMDAAEALSDRLLGCKGAQPAPGCAVTVLYQGYGLRALTPAQVFRGLMLSFALAEADPRFVGVNIVAPEDYPVAVDDYDLHMAMIRFLAGKYPGVKRSLHAGELTLGIVPPTALRDHIRKAIEVAGARRIGHGVDIAHETQAADLLARMARDKIAVEINLTSNDVILGVRGREHPLALYRAAGVPFVLSTDDEGVSRSDMTNEYMRAALEQGLRYADLKEAARAGLEYSFLPGASLWAGGVPGTAPAPVCAGGETASCAAFLKGSLKARLQAGLEKDFARFERKIVNWRF